MASPLSFGATFTFRNRLLKRNLPPYNSDGFTSTSNPAQGDFSVNDYAVSDLPEVEEIGKTQAVLAYIKNAFAPSNGYGEPITITDVFIGNANQWTKQPYNTFIASRYSAFSLLTDTDPNGSSGRLSDDSSLAKISATSLREQFQFRINQELEQQTIGRINVLDPNNDAFDALDFATGRRGILERDWKISVPDSLAGKGLDFVSRVSGVYVPYSFIPGDYFSQKERKSLLNTVLNNNPQTGNLNLPTTKTGSDIFLKNTGGGQSSRLFKSLRENKYRPDYKLNFVGDLNLTAPNPNYYIGNRTRPISSILAKPDELPVNPDGFIVQSAVRGYFDLATIYENTNKPLRFGLAADAFYDNSKALMGGFTWVSSQFSDLAGRKVGRGGELYETDSGFDGASGIGSDYKSTESTNYEFREGGILDTTQRLINAANQLGGDAKLQHVGNAIDQVSKVFNDGVRELTKGSRVIRYINTENNQIVGKEYCRVFTKDTPYYTIGDLQKTQGITNENRRFEFSVLDKTYNLNIAPMRGEESTNISNNAFTSEGVKKYMFSIENLAWRTSNKKGFTYQDLPNCEKGPNGGRIMWFPPYSLDVSETSAANWNENRFLGRPEPVYTYNETSRVGNLSWKIVVDHPSILNAIVDKELNGKTNKEINDIVDSFFAGCRTYDIYELAKRFPQFTYSDIYNIIENTVDPEQARQATIELGENVDFVNGDTTEDTDKVIEDDPNTYQAFEFYFDNAIPLKRSSGGLVSIPPDEFNYIDFWEDYKNSKTRYINGARPVNKDAVKNFFENKIDNFESITNDFKRKLGEALNKGGKVTITLKASASAPDNEQNNQSLSERRAQSVINYIRTFEDANGKLFSVWEDEGKLIFNPPQNVGEETTISFNGRTIDCSNDLPEGDEEYSVNAMACRRVRIDNVVETYTKNEKSIKTEEPVNPTPEQPSGEPKRGNDVSLTRKEQVAKIIVRKLLTECDYFEAMKEDSPMVYDGIKEKLKYFHPAFHSTTPEGLNSRLTFLQQCVRPGDTIPVIGVDGRPVQGEAKNTSFGAPPICVLRIGDFYHTKIAINQIGVQYDPLVFDLNPEGIGVQPMIATINMSFYFIGGQGLKEPVARLQNALSFNFYANTEIYDERSVVTDESANIISQEVWDDIQNETQFGINNFANEDNVNVGVVGQTIGEIQTEQFVSLTGNLETLTGTTSFNRETNKLITNSQSYVRNVVNTLETINNEYGFDLLKYFFPIRRYIDGEIAGYFGGVTPKTTRLFGKPNAEDYNFYIDDLFSKAIEDVNNDTSPLLGFTTKKYSRSDIKKLKKSIINKIQIQKQIFINQYASLEGNLLKNQEELIKTIDRLNYVLTDSDAYITKNGKVITFNLTGQTGSVVTRSGAANTMKELELDIKDIGDDLLGFYNQIFNTGDGLLGSRIPYNTSYNFSIINRPLADSPEQVRLLNIFYREILNDPQGFIDTIIAPSGINEDLAQELRKIIIGQSSTDGLVYYYRLVQKNGKNAIDSFKNTEIVKSMLDYKPFDSTRNRIVNYTKVRSESADQTKINNFREVVSDLNSGSFKIFNGKKKLK